MKIYECYIEHCVLCPACTYKTDKKIWVCTKTGRILMDIDVIASSCPLTDAPEPGDIGVDAE